MAYKRLNLNPSDIWKASHVEHIEDTLEALVSINEPVVEVIETNLPTKGWLSQYSFTTEFTQDFIFLDTACLIPADYKFESVSIVCKKTGDLRVYFLNSENFNIETFHTVTATSVGTNTFDMTDFTYDTTKAHYIAIAGLVNGGSIAAAYSNPDMITGYRWTLEGTEKTSRNYPLGYMITISKTLTYDKISKVESNLGNLDELLVDTRSDIVSAINKVVTLTCDVTTSEISLPTSTWLDTYSYTTAFTQDIIFLDTACILPANYKFESIDLISKQAGAMRVYFMDRNSFGIDTYTTVIASAGKNTFDMSTVSYDRTKDYYIAIAGVSGGGSICADYSNDNKITGYRFNADGSEKTSRNYPLGYVIHASLTTLNSQENGSNSGNVDTTMIGDLNNLNTSNKTNLVGAINEVAEEVMGQNVPSTLPSETWMTDYSYTTEFTQGYIFGDTRCILSPGESLVSIDVAAKSAGNMTVYLLDTAFGIVTSHSISVNAGINYGIDLSSFTYDTSKNYYVALYGDTASLLAKYTATGTYGYRLDSNGANKVARNYPLGYAIHKTTQVDSLKSRVETLETNKLQIVTTVPELEAAVANGGYIFVERGTYELSCPLALRTGTRIEGIRGASIISVPSSVSIGLDMRNVEDIVIQNLTIRGAYNGTPTKSGMQPVAPGIVNTLEDAYALNGIGYQTDLTNLCITEELIPQVGINVNACEKCEILGCEILNFSYAGIMNRLSGKNYRYAMKVNNNYINNCYIGIWTYDEAERTQYIANNVALCQIGFYMDSGTNLLNACSFTANRIGMLLGHGWNHAHGEVTDCAFTHCSLFGLLAKNIQNGQTFNGGKFGYADAESGNGGGYAVWVENSMGIVLQNLKLIQCNSCFTGRLTTTYSKSSTEIDVFGNNHYTYTENTVTAQGAHRIFNCSSTGGTCLISNEAVVTRKENFYLSGADASALND